MANRRSKVWAPELTDVLAEVAFVCKRTVVESMLLNIKPVVQMAVVLDAVRSNSRCHGVVWAVEARTATVIAVSCVDPQKHAISALRAVALETATNVP